MKKLLRLIGIIFLVIVIIVFVYTKAYKSYSVVIYMNWSIKLPSAYEEIYSVNSESSFGGDGERYHIFQYTNDKRIIESLNWKDSKNATMELEVKEVLKTLEVSKEYIPDFESEYKYYTTIKDHSKIYFIFNTDTQKLYSIENIF